MTEDPFKELREQPYDLFIAPAPYSFDLNQDMVDMIREEFNADAVVDQMSEAVGDKSGDDAKAAAEEFFAASGDKWMRKTIQLGEEYSDRTYEVVLETVDRNGEQFLIFPHIPQRLVEIGYLSTQEFMKVSFVLNNTTDLCYQIPQCALFNKIKDKCGEDFANEMTCSKHCMAGLNAIKSHTDLDVLIEQQASTATDGSCRFLMKKL